MKLLRQFHALFRRNQLERDMAEEMRLHLKLQMEKNIAAGLDADEARYTSRRQFGGVEQIKERCRDQRGSVWLEQTLKDFRFAARSLVKAPGFTLAVIGALAVGIGATTAIVSFARPVVFPRIPFPAAERMVVVIDPQVAAVPEIGAPYPFFSMPYRLRSIRDTVTSFEALGGVRQEQANLVVAGEPASSGLGWVTADYFALLGATTECGRLFLPDEYYNKNGDLVVLSWSVWQKRFGGDPAVVGRDILLGGRNCRVIGVLAKRFAPPPFFHVADIYLPETPSSIPTLLPFQWIQVVGRLKPGVTFEQARLELASVHLQAPPETGPEYADKMRPRPIALAAYYGHDTTLHWVFFGAVVFLHAIACSNAASLMLARTVARRRELGIRLAMGGSRWRIIRLLLAESLIVSTLAGVAGVFIAYGGLRALSLPAEMPPGIVEDETLSLPLLVTALTVSLITSILVIVTPALRVGRTTLSDALKEDSGSLGDSRGLRRIRSGLVVVQAALCVTLLAGAGLTLRSFWRLERVSFGFDPAGKLAVQAVLPEGVAPETYLELAARFREQLVALPGVKDATHAGMVPLGNLSTSGFVTIDGRPELGSVYVSCNRISAEYFATIGLSFIEGNGFEDMRPGGRPVVIINQAGARQFFGSGSAMGRYIGDNGQKLEIVGVVSDVRLQGRRGPIGPQLYFPFWQPPVATGALVELVRLETEAPGVGLESSIRRAAYKVDPRLVVTVARLADRARTDAFRERRALVILEVLSALAIVLAATGLFGVVAYMVVQRQREFGVRMALGAAPQDLLWMVLRRGLVLATVGLVVGLGAAWGLTRFLQSVLFDTNPHDPIIYGSVGIGLFLVASLACWFPARRAAKVDPMVALRTE
jgi:putative ABC transport system permease protein